MPLFGAAYAAPNKGTIILHWFRSRKSALNPPVKGKIQGLFRPLSGFQVIFKANLIFKDFSRQSCVFKYFSSLCEPCRDLEQDVFVKHYSGLDDIHAHRPVKVVKTSLLLKWNKLFCIKSKDNPDVLGTNFQNVKSFYNHTVYQFLHTCTCRIGLTPHPYLVNL